MWLFVIDLIDGKISEEEKEKMRERLTKNKRKGRSKRKKYLIF